MDIKRAALLDAFRDVGRQMMRLGLNSSHSGNMSTREGDVIQITRSGAMLGSMKAGDLFTVPFSEEMPDGVSMEYPVHRAIYETSEASAVLHCHPPHAIALSLQSEVIEPVDLEGRHILGTVEVVPQGENMAEVMAEKMGEGAKVIIVKGHGAFAAGPSLPEALHYASALEMSSKIICLASRL